MRRGRKLSIIVVATALVIVASYLFRPRDSFNDAGAKIALAIENNDWGSIYDSASLRERRVLGASREQYIKIADSVISSINRPLKPVNYAPGTDLDGASRPYLFAAFGRQAKMGQPYCFPIHLRRGIDITHPDALTVLLGLNSLAGGDSKSQLTRLHKAMVEARVERLVDFSNDAVLKTDRLSSAIEGKLDRKDIWIPD